MEMSRDAGSIPAASTKKPLAKNRKWLLCWRLRQTAFRQKSHVEARPSNSSDKKIELLRRYFTLGHSKGDRPQQAAIFIVESREGIHE